MELWLFIVSILESNMPTKMSLVVKRIAQRRKINMISDIPEGRIIKRKTREETADSTTFDRAYEELHSAKSYL
jgi:hypothetical protein